VPIVESQKLQLGLFSSSDHGVRLIGRTAAPDLVEAVRSRLAEERRWQLAELEPPARQEPGDPESVQG